MATEDEAQAALDLSKQAPRGNIHLFQPGEFSRTKPLQFDNKKQAIHFWNEHKVEVYWLTSALIKEVVDKVAEGRDQKPFSNEKQTFHSMSDYYEMLIVGSWGKVKNNLDYRRKVGRESEEIDLIYDRYYTLTRAAGRYLLRGLSPYNFLKAGAITASQLIPQTLRLVPSVVARDDQVSAKSKDLGYLTSVATNSQRLAIRNAGMHIYQFMALNHSLHGFDLRYQPEEFILKDPLIDRNARLSVNPEFVSVLKPIVFDFLVSGGALPTSKRVGCPALKFDSLARLYQWMRDDAVPIYQRTIGYKQLF